MTNLAEWFKAFDERLWLKCDKGAEREVAFVRKALHLRKGSRVLDCPCGAGRIAVHIARAGCSVTGVDMTSSFITRAARRLSQAGLKGTFVLTDMREIDFHGEFDAAYNWGGSFGYFSEEENAAFLRSLVRALKPGGRLLVDQPNREFVLRHFRPVLDGGDYTVRTKWNADTERVRSIWTLNGDERRSRSVSTLRLYTMSQFLRLFAKAGAEVEAVYGDLNGGEFRRSSRRMYAVGRKRGGR